MDDFISELIGTAMLILLGNGVVANVVLKDTKGHNSGWIVIALGWGIAVFVAVFMVMPSSGAHLNPAVTLGLAVADAFEWSRAATFIAGQITGAFIGGSLVYLFYKDHYKTTDDAGLKLATFSTAPAIRNTVSNLTSEIIGTFVLVFAIFYIVGASIGDQTASLGALDALPVGLLVLGIGLSLGGTTGYAINPARDLGPRIAHAILPIPGKGSSDWGYAWIPIVGPCIGAVIAGLLFKMLHV